MKDFFRKLPTYPFVSIALLTINGIVFLLCQLGSGRLYDAGCMGMQGVLLEKEYGRLIWSMFLHADVEHLFNNMILLLFMGSMLEKVIGHVPYAVLYFLSGMGGNLLSLLVRVVNNDWSVSIGASGAVFGLDGLLLAAVLLLRHRLKDITPTRVGIMIFLSLYSGFSSSGIDNVAHVGGLLVGLLIGILICAVENVIEIKRSNKNIQARGV